MPALQEPPTFVALDHPAFAIHHETGVDYATWYIGTKAEQLAGHYGFAPDEDEDIRQELLLHLIQQWPAFDPAVAKATTFIQNVIDHKVCDLVREQQYQHQDYRRVQLLTGNVQEGLLDGVRGQPERSEQELVELQSDCAAIIASLPRELREIAELLKELPPTAVAHRLGLSDSKFWYRLAELREHFVAAGYGDITDSDDTNDEECE